MDAFSPKTILIITLGGCLLICSLYFYLFHIPNRKLIYKNTNNIKKIQQKIRLTSSKVTNLQEEITSFDSPHIHLNYFNRLNLSEPKRIPHLLKGLTTEANALGIKFISVDPKSFEKNKFYQKHRFMVGILATQFSQMLQFLNRIENKLKLNIDELTIQQDEDNSNQLHAKMSLNTLEMMDNRLKKFYSIAQVKNFYLDPNWQNKITETHDSRFTEFKKKLVATQTIKRNPFDRNTIMSSLLLKAEKFLPVKKNGAELVLSAIMDFQGERIAILGNDQLKKGGILKNAQVGNRYIDMKVLKIEENSITLGNGQNKYVFKLPDNPITF